MNRMGGSAPNSRCTLSSFPSVDIYGRLTEEFCRFAAILLCSGVTLMLVEVDGQNVCRWVLRGHEDRSGTTTYNS